MTKEAFIEALVERGHEAWGMKERGKKVDITILIGRRTKEGQELEPMISVLDRGKLIEPIWPI